MRNANQRSTGLGLWLPASLLLQLGAFADRPGVHYDDDGPGGPKAVAGLYKNFKPAKMRVGLEVYESPAPIGLYYSYGLLTPKIPLIPDHANQISMSKSLRIHAIKLDGPDPYCLHILVSHVPVMYSCIADEVVYDLGYHLRSVFGYIIEQSGRHLSEYLPVSARLTATPKANLEAAQSLMVHISPVASHIDDLPWSRFPCRMISGDFTFDSMSQVAQVAFEFRAGHAQTQILSDEDLAGAVCWLNVTSSTGVGPGPIETVIEPGWRVRIGHVKLDMRQFIPGGVWRASKGEQHNFKQTNTVSEAAKFFRDNPTFTLKIAMQFQDGKGRFWGLPTYSFVKVVSPEVTEANVGSSAYCGEPDEEVDSNLASFGRVDSSKMAMGCMRRCRFRNICLAPHERRFAFLFGPNNRLGSDMTVFPPPAIRKCDDSTQQDYFMDVMHLTYDQISQDRPPEWVDGTTVLHPESCDVNIWHYISEEVSGLWRNLRKAGYTFEHGMGEQNVSLLLWPPKQHRCDPAAAPKRGFFDTDFRRRAGLRIMSLYEMAKQVENDATLQRHFVCFEELIVGTHVDRMVKRSTLTDSRAATFPVYRHDTKWTKQDGLDFRLDMFRLYQVTPAEQQAMPAEVPLVAFIVRKERRRLGNQDEIIAYVGKRRQESGTATLALYNFEDMSLSEQLERLQPVNVLVALHGAALIHVLFLRPGSVAIEIHLRSMDSAFGMHKFVTERISSSTYIYAPVAWDPRWEENPREEILARGHFQADTAAATVFLQPFAYVQELFVMADEFDDVLGMALEHYEQNRKDIIGGTFKI